MIELMLMVLFLPVDCVYCNHYEWTVDSDVVCDLKLGGSPT